MFNAPIEVPPPGEYVADGAARQAAWVLTGELPSWNEHDAGQSQYFEPAFHAEIRANFRDAWKTLFT
jgi:xylulokinase